MVGRRVGELLMGTSAFGSRYSTADSLAALRAGLEAGIDAIDTAPSYGYGLAESIVGQALRESGSAPLVVTKVGIEAAAGSSRESTRSIARGALRVGGPLVRPLRRIVSSRRRAVTISPDTIQSSLERSLSRIGREVDVLLLHGADLADVQRGDVWDSLRRHQSEGRIGQFGVSGTPEAIAYVAENVDDAWMLQVPARRFDLPRDRTTFHHVAGYSPFGGLGRVDPARRTFERWSVENSVSVSFEDAVFADVLSDDRLDSVVSLMGSPHRVHVALAAIARKDDAEVQSASIELRRQVECSAKPVG